MLFRFAQAVADARLGPQLLPEVADIDPEVLRVLGMRRASHRRQQLALGDHPSRRVRECREQLPLARGAAERLGLAIQPRDPARQVDSSDPTRSRARNSASAKGFST